MWGGADMLVWGTGLNCPVLQVNSRKAKIGVKSPVKENCWIREPGEVFVILNRANETNFLCRFCLKKTAFSSTQRLQRQMKTPLCPEKYLSCIRYKFECIV